MGENRAVLTSAVLALFAVVLLLVVPFLVLLGFLGHCVEHSGGTNECPGG
ncbi:hypothetical protein [Amycolatopsis balhimycina]|nr:hypothetical protein [Amycolatopsis balhimycina]